MKSIKIIISLLLVVGPIHCNTVTAKNRTKYRMTVDFLDSSGDSHANMQLNPEATDTRDIGSWCTARVRGVVTKPNGGYGGTVEVKAGSCGSFDIAVGVRQSPKNSYKELCIVKTDSGAADPDFSQVSESECYSLPKLLSATTQNSIIANGTNANIVLFNAPSLGSGATSGVPVALGATIPFYLNAGSSGEELVIKGNGAGTVSFGNDYAKHKTTWTGSTNISKFLVVDGNGAATSKKLNAQGQLVIDPLERVDITTPAGDWEIKLKVAEEIK